MAITFGILIQGFTLMTAVRFIISPTISYQKFDASV